MKATECDQCATVTNNQTAGNACHTCKNGIMFEIQACPDCGDRNEDRGHMTCQYPSNEALT